MLPAASFVGGLLASRSLSPWESCSPCKVRSQRPVGSTAFKLTVNVHAASAPSIGRPGHVQRSLPRFEFTLGDGVKNTEEGEYIVGMPDCVTCDVDTLERFNCKPGSENRRTIISACEDRKSIDAAVEFPWVFRDSVTFAVHVDDIIAAGLHCHMLTHSQLLVGPLQLQLGAAEIGETVVDIRRNVLPACSPTSAARDGAPLWATPVNVVPLTRIESDPHSGKRLAVVAQVALSFTVNVDPMVLQLAVFEAERPIAERMLGHVGHCTGGCTASEHICGNDTVVARPACVDDVDGEETLDAASIGSLLPIVAARATTHT